MKYYILFNSKSGKCENQKTAESLKSLYPNDEVVLQNVLEIDEYETFINSIKNEANIIICGGDGTLNYFINHTLNIDFNNDVLYFPSGSGNDFARDVDKLDTKEPFSIKEYIHNLPLVEVNGIKSHFINGVGYGIDGYCCEEGDKLHALNKKVDYTSIAIKGLLFHYKPTNATVIVDGVEYKYKKVWLSPIMFGRYYGGGMMPTPNQDRKGERKLSTMIFHGSGKLKTLMIFPSLFKGEHVKKEKHVSVLSGKVITIKFDSPRAAQIDGETVLNVEELTCRI